MLEGQIMKTKHIEMHSAEWNLAVETGWITAFVETTESGVRLATMLLLAKRG